MMKDTLGNEGFSRIVQITMIVLVLLIAVPFVHPYQRYIVLQWEMNSIMSMNAGKPAAIRKEIMSYAAENRIPLLDKNLVISKVKKRTTVQIHWIDEIDHYGYHKRPLSFTINDKY